MNRKLLGQPMNEHLGKPLETYRFGFKEASPERLKIAKKWNNFGVLSGYKAFKRTQTH